jgi:hypothetical protein
MRNLLAFVGALVVTVAGLGYYLGWYTVHTGPSPSGRRVTFDIDTGKIGDDLHPAEQKIEKKLGQRGQQPGAQPGGLAGSPKAEGARPKAAKGPSGKDWPGLFEESERPDQR